MDDFRLYYTTEIKTQSQDTALMLIKCFHDGRDSPFGRIVSFERTDGIANTLWVFDIIEDKI